jgi:hypothetical protein
MLSGMSRHRVSSLNRRGAAAKPPVTLRESLVVGAAVVQALFAIVVGYYASQADKLARAQIEPALEAEVTGFGDPGPPNSLVIENAGRDPIIDIIVKPAMAILVDGKATGPRQWSKSTIPGDKQEWLWRIERLGPHEIRERSIASLLDSAVASKNGTERLAAEGELEAAGAVRKHPDVVAVVVLQISYRREADGKRFVRNVRVIAGDFHGMGVAVRSGWYWATWGSAIDRLDPER